MSDVSVPFLGQELTPVSSAKDQGVMRDSNLTFNEHVSSPSLLPFIYPWYQVDRVRHFFLEMYPNLLFFSKLFYCSTVWSGTSNENIHKLQLLQNFAARILANIKNFDHISPVLNGLGWLTTDELAWRDYDLYIH